MGAVAVDMQPGRQQDPVFNRYRTVRKWCNEEFIPTCSRDGKGLKKSMREKKQNKQIPVQKFTQHSSKMNLTTKCGGDSNESIKLRGKRV